MAIPVSMRKLEKYIERFPVGESRGMEISRVAKEIVLYLIEKSNLDMDYITLDELQIGIDDLADKIDQMKHKYESDDTAKFKKYLK